MHPLDGTGPDVGLGLCFKQWDRGYLGEMGWLKTKVVAVKMTDA